MADATHNISRNLGGDRLGSGSKMNVNLHAYNRSTHDLSRAWRSSMNVGTLVPFLVEPALPGDTFSIDLEALVRTTPAIAPLYGSYKLQLDVFECPIRLYNGLLHNNMLSIGMNMSQVKLPKLNLVHSMQNPAKFTYEINNSQIASDALLKYLGVSGIGDAWFTSQDKMKIERKINAVPLLAYFDIVKNYYANKQEIYMQVIAPQIWATNNTRLNADSAKIYIEQNEELVTTITWDNDATLPTGVTITGPNYAAAKQNGNNVYLWVGQKIELVQKGLNITSAEMVIYDQVTDTYDEMNFADLFTVTQEGDRTILTNLDSDYNGWQFVGLGFNNLNEQYEQLRIKKILIDDVDNTRIEILKNTGLGNELSINTLAEDIELWEIFTEDENDRTKNRFHQNGLALKTYQSDIFNNWLKTEWIDGTGGITEITAIDTSSGSFSIDALNLAKKVYNMLNRIAVSGGSYEDYIEAVYSTNAVRRAETPVYMGGMSAEIVFEEVVSQSATAEQPLGSLAGKGTTNNKRGGHIEIRVEEPSFIMGIVSITPRIDYSQGNKWFMFELDSLDDLHKPALDGIGFEDLLQERAAWWGTEWLPTTNEWRKLAMGKVPAWINYMTANNETYGDFAEPDKTMTMTLNRRYEYHEKKSLSSHGIADPTTYVNPTKFNYTFADTSLEAQNFWVQIGMKIDARRVMSAKIIPNM